MNHIRISLLLAIVGLTAQPLSATDYFLTVGGGYSRTGNQASLEANVVFFQQLLADKHPGPRQHDVFFADGDDPGADLQIVPEKAVKSDTPATDLLAVLHRRRGGANIAYRNHRVPDLAGPLDPALIRKRLESIGKTATSGDRLIVYVTAHGSPGGKDDKFNTTIDCWNGKKIAAREFTNWLSKLPTEMPVVMVMAQCYCGGFSRVMFDGLDEKQGPATQLRAGFFAQQHDLPAAGCRPDIEHDQEFSSYFWGALAGKSRNGVPIEGCDADGNGVISFAEAYAYAVVAGETIDIPLRTSEVFLRTYSRLKDDQDAVAEREAEPGEPEVKERPAMFTLSGTVESLAEKGRPVSSRIVTQLSKTLGLSLQDDVKSVTKAYEDNRRASRSPGGRGRGRQSSGRRELLREVSEKWPELGEDKWADSALLEASNQETLLADIKQLPSWKNYEERLHKTEEADEAGDGRELRSIKFRRLINTLEAIVLEKNLPRFATPELVERYQRLIALEESSFSPPKTP